MAEDVAAALATLVEKHGATVTALGTPRGLERDLVPARGFDLQLIDPVPVPRRPNLDLLKLPFRVVGAVRQARRILRDVDADVLIGFGGYVAANYLTVAEALELSRAELVQLAAHSFAASFVAAEEKAAWQAELADYAAAHA